MEVIFILIPLALLLAAVFIVGFIWMAKTGQYDDLETPRHRMLLDAHEKTQNKNDLNNKPRNLEGKL